MFVSCQQNVSEKITRKKQMDENQKFLQMKSLISTINEHGVKLQNNGVSTIKMYVLQFYEYLHVFIILLILISKCRLCFYLLWIPYLNNKHNYDIVWFFIPENTRGP